MTLEEKLISCCKYYKGEEECPFEPGSKKGIFWDFERTTVRITEFDDSYSMDNIKEGIKNFVSALIDKWLPYDTELMSEY